MAFIKTQSKQGAGSGTSLNITIDPTVLNSLVVVNIKLNGATQTVTSVTDNKGNTYALANTRTDNGIRCYQFYGVQNTNETTQVTVSLSGSLSLRVAVDEFTGGEITNASVFDKVATNSGNMATSASVASFSPTAAGSLISCGVNFTGATSITAGSGYTIGFSHTNQSTQYKLSSSGAETAPMTWTTVSDWIEIAGIYKPYTGTTKTRLMPLLGVG